MMSKTRELIEYESQVLSVGTSARALGVGKETRGWEFACPSFVRLRGCGGQFGPA